MVVFATHDYDFVELNQLNLEDNVEDEKGSILHSKAIIGTLIRF